MGQIEPENVVLFALEFGKIAESDFVYTLASTNINQSAPNLVKMYVIIISRMILIMDLIGPELSKLSALNQKIWSYLLLNLEKLLNLTVYTLASTDINQSAPNFVKMYVIIISQIILIMDHLIGQELSELSALEFDNLPYLTFFTLYHLQI